MERMNTLLSILFSLCIAHLGISQVVPPEDNPCDAPPQCGFNVVDQYDFIMKKTPTSCNWPDEPACQLDDPHWFAIVAGSNQVDMTFSVANCIINNGVQFSVYEGDPTCTVGCNYTGLDGPWAGNCLVPLLPGGNPHQYNFATTPGYTYYLVFDGYSDDFCEISIQIDDGGEAPMVDEPNVPVSIDFPEFNGPDTICAGATGVTISLPELPFGASRIIWTLNGGNEIEGSIGEMSIDLPANLVDTPGTIEVCAYALNDCDTSNTVCKEYAVAYIDSTFEEFTVCEGESFSWDNGPINTENITENKTITDHSTRYVTAGCQYQAHLTLNIINENNETPNQVYDVICEGDTYTHPSGFSTNIGVEDSEYITTNTQGCDEYYNFTIEVIGGDFTVLPPDDCNGDSSITMKTIFTPILPNTVPIDDPDLEVEYQWYVNSNPIPGATADTLIVTQDLVENNPFGQYNVHVTMAYEGESCEFVSTTVGLEAADFLHHFAPIQCTFGADTLNYDLSNPTTTCPWPNDTVCQLENPQWGAFVGDSDSVTMNLIISDCMSTDKGVQFSVYEGKPNCFEPCNFSGLKGPLTGNCNQHLIPAENPHIFTFPIKPGYPYYFVIDGYDGDNCEVSLSVDRTIQASNPDLPISDNIQISAFEEADTICAGAENLEVFLTNLPDNASRLHWTVDTAEIKGALGASTIPIPNRYIDSTGRLNICVQAVNDCAESDTVCRAFTIAMRDSVVEQYSICEGESFSWDNGPINTENIEELLVVEQQAMRSDTQGCPYSAILNLTIYPTIELIDTSVVPDDGSGNGSINPEFSGEYPPYTYLWSTGDTTNAISGLHSGTYMLTVTNSLGCEEVFSFFVDMKVTTEQVDQSALQGVRMFPNPLSGDVLYFLWEDPRDHRLRIFNTEGRLLRDVRMEADRKVEVPLVAPLQSGLYIIELQANQARGYYRLILH